MQLPDRLLTEAEAAEILDVAEVTLRKWRGQGKIAFTQLGASIKYTPDQLMEFINNGAQPALCSRCKEEVHVA